MTARSAGDNSWSLAIEINTGTGGLVSTRFLAYNKMLGRTDTRTRESMYCQTIRTVRDISRDDRARIATCSLRTPTVRLKENYSIDSSSHSIVHASVSRPLCRHLHISKLNNICLFQNTCLIYQCHIVMFFISNLLSFSEQFSVICEFQYVACYPFL